jgi:hypothetical protein
METLYSVPTLSSADVLNETVVAVVNHMNDDIDEKVIVNINGSTIASGDDDDDDEDDAVSSSADEYADVLDMSTTATTSSVMQNMFELFISVCISLLLKSLFGGLYVIRSLVLGFLLNYVIRFVSVTEQAAERWIPQQLNVAVAVTTMEPHLKGTTSTTWPPPTLIGLGILTFVALIVHPDGYTWIILHKIRYVGTHEDCTKLIVILSCFNSRELDARENLFIVF